MKQTMSNIKEWLIEAILMLLGALYWLMSLTLFVIMFIIAVYLIGNTDCYQNPLNEHVSCVFTDNSGVVNGVADKIKH